MHLLKWLHSRSVKGLKNSGFAPIIDVLEELAILCSVLDQIDSPYTVYERIEMRLRVYALKRIVYGLD